MAENQDVEIIDTESEFIHERASSKERSGVLKVHDISDLGRPTPGDIPNAVPSWEIPNAVPSGEIPNAVPSGEIPNAVPSRESPNVIQSGGIPKAAMSGESKNAIPSKDIPNAAQVDYDDGVNRSVKTPVSEKPKSVTENRENITENDLKVTEVTNKNENKTRKSPSAISKWKKPFEKAGTSVDGEQNVLGSNNNNSLTIAKTDDISNSDSKTSLLVPPYLSTDSKSGQETRRDSNALKDGSKISLLSSISNKTQPKADFTLVQIPEDDKKAVPTYEDSWIRVAVPYLPLWVAIICLLLNIVLSGSGTIISGLCIFCCGKSRVPPKYDQDPILISCVNLWVGLAQLFTVTFLLVGWFWSVAWGIRMVLLSLERRQELRELRALQLKQQTINAFGGLARRM